MSQLLTDPKARLALVRELLEGVSLAREPGRSRLHFGSCGVCTRLICTCRRLCVGWRAGSYKLTRLIDTREAAAASDGGVSLYARMDPWRHWSTLPTYEGGLIGQLIDRGEPVVMRLDGLRDDPALGPAALEMRSVMATPIFDRGRPVNWALQFARAPDTYDDEAAGNFVMVANLAGTATRNLVSVREAERATVRLRTQFEEVARVQQSLLPRTLPSIPGLKVATSYLTSDEAGVIIMISSTSRTVVGAS